MGGLIRDFLRFAWQEKKWWLVPLGVLFIVTVLIVILSGGSGISWALYPNR
jgi:hypothetical protein